MSGRARRVDSPWRALADGGRLANALKDEGVVVSASLERDSPRRRCGDGMGKQRQSWTHAYP